MPSDPEKLLNQLLTTALTAFTLFALLLAALIIRQLWLQQHVAALTDDLQADLAELLEVAEEIEAELEEAEAAGAVGEAERAAEVAEVAALVDDVEDQLLLIEADLEEVSAVLDEELFAPEDAPAGPAALDEIFTVVSALIALVSLVIAWLLWRARGVEVGARTLRR
ncbi:MAG: hypothetical protein R3272_07600 [Candidatus Promineifilaceae bacterium]|nr:hypothetical protein [Candidatus Promineifilaceae bacterium]